MLKIYGLLLIVLCLAAGIRAADDVIDISVGSNVVLQ